MSSAINVRSNFPAIAARLETLPDKIGDRAMVRALNTTIRQGQTQMAREISQEFRIKVGDVKRRLAITRAASKGQLRFQAVLAASSGRKGRSMNLIHFVTNQPTRNKKGKLGQLKFQVKRSGGKKSIPGAFVATNKQTGGTAVFVRKGKDRYPIETIMTLGVPQMFNTKQINGAVRKVIIEKFQANFKRELRSVLGGWVK